MIAQVTFSYDTQAPELVSLTSEAGVHLNPVSGYEEHSLTVPLSVVTATFDDESGGGVDFSKTAIGDSSP